MERYGEGTKHMVFGKKEKIPEFNFEKPKFKPQPTKINLPSIGELDEEHFARK